MSEKPLAHRYFDAYEAAGSLEFECIDAIRALEP